MEREKESSELASRVELFVVRSAAGFPIDFWSQPPMEGTSQKYATKDFWQKIYNARKEVPTNSYDLDEIGRQKMVF